MSDSFCDPPIFVPSEKGYINFIVNLCSFAKILVIEDNLKSDLRLSKFVDRYGEFQYFQLPQLFSRAKLLALSEKSYMEFKKFWTYFELNQVNVLGNDAIYKPGINSLPQKNSGIFIIIVPYLIHAEKIENYYVMYLPDVSNVNQIHIKSEESRNSQNFSIKVYNESGIVIRERTWDVVYDTSKMTFVEKSDGKQILKKEIVLS